MSTTMVRKFCTLKEAAERLNATEDQIENLLRKGVLREFRDGSHRLLRTADIGAILVAKKRRLERRNRPPGDGGPVCGPVDARAQASRHPAAGPRTTAVARPPRDIGSQSPRRRPAYSGESYSRTSRPRAPRKRRTREALPPRPSLSVREWLWAGLTQDRPIAIALLSGLVLLVLAGLVAGACVLADLH